MDCLVLLDVTSVGLSQCGGELGGVAITLFVCLFATVLRSFLLLFIFFATNNPAGCYSTLKEESERVSEAGGLHF